MQRRLGDALAVYVDAMRYPRGTEDQRASMWLEHTHRQGWKAVAAGQVPDQQDMIDRPTGALGAAPVLRVAFRDFGAPGPWWQEQVGQRPYRVRAGRMR